MFGEVTVATEYEDYVVDAVPKRVLELRARLHHVNQARRHELETSGVSVGGRDARRHVDDQGENSESRVYASHQWPLLPRQ